jgi:hypothetical protein
MLAQINEFVVCGYHVFIAAFIIVIAGLLLMHVATMGFPTLLKRRRQQWKLRKRGRG